MQACLRLTVGSGPRFLAKCPAGLSRVASTGSCEVLGTFFGHCTLKIRNQDNKKADQLARGHNHFSIKATSTDMAVSTEKAESGISTVVEHIVLFKLKDNVSAETTHIMFKCLQELKSLDGVLHLTAGPVLSVEGAEFTHILHGRYKDKEALAAYSKHPEHVNIVKKFVLPNAADILALDWECEPSGNFKEGFGAGRVTLMKVKEGASQDTKALVDAAYKFSSRFTGVGQVSAGPNFAPARAKGYNCGFLAFFESAKEAETLHSSGEHKKWQESEVTPFVDSLIVVDYKF